MTTEPLLETLSTQLADAVSTAAPSVVQVQGRSRPASGIVYGDDVVLTMVGVLGREDGPHVRRHDGETFDAALVGWDPTTSLAVLRVAGLKTPPIVPADARARVGNIALAVARSWSNSLTASAGIVSVIGGPLRTGRRRAIDEVIRTTAPMHEGFAGGAFIDTGGRLLGIATSTAIRGLGVVIPSTIVWRTAQTVLEHGGVRRGYLGVAGQPVELAGPQAISGHERALLVVAVTPDSPAATSGVLVGDLIVEFDGTPITSPEDLLDVLAGDRVGRTATVRVLRGGTPRDLIALVGERPTD